MNNHRSLPAVDLNDNLLVESNYYKKPTFNQGSSNQIIKFPHQLKVIRFKISYAISYLMLKESIEKIEKSKYAEERICKLL